MDSQLASRSKAQRRTWFYWFMIGLALYSIVWDALLELDFFTHPLAVASAFQLPLLRAVTALVIVPAIVLIAWLVLRQAPGNVVGLLLLAWSATIIAGSLRADSPLARYSLNFTWPAVILLPIYFPDGRPSPHRLGWLIDLFAVSAFVSLALFNLSTPWVAPAGVHISSPLFIPALAPFASIIYRMTGVSVAVLTLLLIPSLILRYRGADRRERSQMKWLMWFTFMFFIAGSTLAATGLFGDPYRYGNIGALLLGAFYVYFAVFIPLGLANAILRHRLYDIDILIRHTLIDATLTAILVLVYVVAIVLTQGVLRLLTGQTSDVAIVISTLVIAALFLPVRQRVQTAIDRRFYRRKYDAEQTLAAFSTTLRNEVDVDKVSAALIGLVQDTMQPTYISLWLQESDEKSANTSSTAAPLSPTIPGR